ncbi:N-acetylmuramic acid 6-phosphate etherase [Seinonella peptonophila]|uniref:N-acetylmuramic acid 6-phosphate etherase n=1 Tax=Seinonella peptonophila TaxID=112248 RepID=A0A1M4SY69_9BACL|nr:N-acetylmuramic acid 6-phosphate etherase [Seinonella peptonophila]SHE37178.1 N-acetylmuramic acid 6-phosphate etherase [Seinonella peptonophila]
MEKLTTEQQNLMSKGLDQLSPLQIITLMNKEDQIVAEAIQKELPTIASSIESIVERCRKGGRIIYMGAGTSGRLGVMDAAECGPTFGVQNDKIMAKIAGGEEALYHAVEKSEDRQEDAIEDLQCIHLRSVDSVIGITASGQTPYVISALSYALEIGALTVLLTVNKGFSNKPFDHVIAIETGPEVIAGSTRLKAGTAQKMVLNMISTTTMVQLGKVYDNLMVDVQITNQKLRNRAISIVSSLTGLPANEAHQLLEKAKGHVKTAIVMNHFQLSYLEAKSHLRQCSGNLRDALSRKCLHEDR